MCYLGWEWSPTQESSKSYDANKGQLWQKELHRFLVLQTFIRISWRDSCKWQSPFQISWRRNYPLNGLIKIKRHLKIWSRNFPRYKWVLIFFNFTKPFKVHTMRIFCHQRYLHARWASDSFLEQELLGAQLKWLIHEMELYVMVNCLKTWQHYLGTHKTKVFTNNGSRLKYFKTQPKAMAKQLHRHWYFGIDGCGIDPQIRLR